jgi:DNA-binding Lrp family transcriptional regulator
MTLPYRSRKSARGSACPRRHAGNAFSGSKPMASSSGVLRWSITVFVSIETGDHSQDWLDQFAKTVGAMPEVMEFYRMAGDVDYMLRVVVTDIAGYDTFYKKLISAVPLKNVTSRFAMEKIKSTTSLPIPAAP